MKKIQLLSPHQGQLEILREAKQFNVVNCGRRWGKTEFATNTILEPALEGDPAAYYAPTYKDLEDFWSSFKNVTHDLIKEKSEQNKSVELITGGKIDFWSLDKPDSSRGRKYKRVVIDEAEKIKKLKYAWEKTVMPTLLDYNGDAWILSTPNRLANPLSYFLDTLCTQEDRHDNWITFRGSTYDNPYISKKVIEQFKQSMDDLSFQQEILALDVSSAEKPFIYSFTEEHIEDYEYNVALPLYLSFDFNVDPCTCLISQHEKDWIHHFDEVRLENSGTYEVCEEVKSRYPNALYVVTGDASGRARSTTSKRTNYDIIKHSLSVNNKRLQVAKSNPSISDSKTLTNSLFARHNVKVSQRCKYLIEDLKFIQVKEDGTMDKGADKRKSHLLDCLRYHDWTWFNWWINKRFLKEKFTKFDDTKEEINNYLKKIK